MRPIRWAYGEANGFSKRRVGDTESIAEKGCDMVHKAAEAFDDKLGKVVNNGYDEFTNFVSSGFEGVGTGFCNSRGEIPTPIELLWPCCR